MTTSPTPKILINPKPAVTYDEAVQLLRDEVASADSVTLIAEKYGIKRQRLSDILSGRAKLSGEALRKLKFELRYRRLA